MTSMSCMNLWDALFSLITHQSDQTAVSPLLLKRALVFLAMLHCWMVFSALKPHNE